MLLALSGWLLGLSVMGFFLVCLILILTVLIQKPQGGGLSGAFGSSAGSGQTAFGAKTGDALTIFTIAIFVVYIVAAVALNFALTPKKADVANPQAGASTTTTTPGAPGTTPTPQPTPTPETPFGAVPVQISPQPVQITPAPTPATTPAPTPAPSGGPASVPATTPSTSPATTPPSTTPPASTPAPAEPAPKPTP